MKDQTQIEDFFDFLISLRLSFLSGIPSSLKCRKIPRSLGVLMVRHPQLLSRNYSISKISDCACTRDFRTEYN